MSVALADPLPAYGCCRWCDWTAPTRPSCTAELAAVENELGRHVLDAHRDRLG